MKNKHLVLLFLSVLALGIAARWLPLQYRTMFETKLLRLDAGSINRMAIGVPGNPDLQFEHMENGWSVEQDGRASVVQTGTVQALLGILCGITSFELVKTGMPDSLGLASDHALRVQLFAQKKRLETIEIGDEITLSGRSFTYIRLPGHAGVYRVPGHLRQFFGRSLHDFRDRTLVTVPPDAVRRIVLSRPGPESLVLEKQDSTGIWISPNHVYMLSSDTVHAWLGLFNLLNNSPFADYFDESQELETLYATIVLATAEQEQTLRIFYLEPPDVPEELAVLRTRDRRFLTAFVLHSSGNPLNYFAMPDSNLVHRLCSGLKLLQQ